jgi:hypothetical protein
MIKGKLITLGTYKTSEIAAQRYREMLQTMGIE